MKRNEAPLCRPTSGWYPLRAAVFYIAVIVGCAYLVDVFSTRLPLNVV